MKRAWKEESGEISRAVVVPTVQFFRQCQNKIANYRFYYQTPLPFHFQMLTISERMELVC